MSSLWISSERVLQSKTDLRDVDMFVYTHPTGILGRLIGRALRLRVQSFSWTIRRRDRSLRQVCVQTESLVPQCEVLDDNRKQERIALTSSESGRVLRRVRNAVLHTARYPEASFDVTQDSVDRVEGTLHLHGESHAIVCTKHVEAGELLVRCPVRMSQFHITPYRLWLGLFSVADTVEVETRIPAHVLHV